MTDPVSTAGRTQSAAMPAMSPAPGLGQQDFLKLLVAQLQQQDPLDPVGGSDFVGELAQFSTLEQIMAVEQSLERLVFAAQAAQATALIGRAVSYERPDGTVGQGAVDAVSFDQGTIALLVGEVRVPPSAVRTVLSQL